MGVERGSCRMISKESLRALYRLALDCRGANGQSVLTQPASRSRDGALTNTSNRIFADPIIRLLVSSTISAQNISWQDGGLLSLSLACRCIVDGLDYRDAVLTCGQLRSAYYQVLQWCILGLEEISTTLDWNDLESVLALVHGIVTPKQGGGSGQEINTICLAIVRAFLNSISPTSTTPCVRVLGHVGMPTSKTKSVDGVLLDVALPPGADKMLPIENACVALFSVPLAPDTHGTDKHYDSQLRKLFSLVQRLAKQGVRVAGCQKEICPEVSHIMLRFGILPVSRISARHLEYVSRCTGARAVGDIHLQGAWEAQFGQTSLVRAEGFGPKTYVHLLPPEPSCSSTDTNAVQTLVVCGLSEAFVEELTAVSKSALAGLSLAFKDSRVVDGGGSTEDRLAEIIHKRTLQAGHRYGSLQWRAANTIAETLREWVASQESRLLDGGRVLELVGAKQSALSLAVETASTLLGISRVLVEA